MKSILNRKILLVTVVSLILLFSWTAGEPAGDVPPNRYILITKATCGKGRANISCQNNTDREITEYTLYVIPRDEAGEPIRYSDMPGDEPRYYTVTRSLPVKGKSAVTEPIGPGEGDPAVKSMDIALYRLCFSDGETVEISDTDLYWFSTAAGSYQEAPPRTAANAYPDHETLARAGSFRAGFQEIVLHEWDAAHYGYHSGGKLVMEVDPVSLSEKAGLQAGDLIVAVDGVLFKDDRYIIEKGKARMADGLNVTVTVERPGQEGTLDLAFSR